MRRLADWWRFFLKAALFAGAAFVLLCPDPAIADSRIALVIGNSSYRNVARLENPERDAAAIADVLTRIGFEVTLVRNAGRNQIVSALKSFRRRAPAAEIAVIYYAGHGLELEGENYLVPVDAELKNESDVDFELVSLDLAIRSVADAKSLGLVILDACRNNPFVADMAGSGGKRAIGRGFARIEPSTNTLVAYAAKAGTVADDGDGAHSPYTAALLRRLVEPGIAINFVFGEVRDDVLEATNRRQEPFVYGSLGARPIFLVPVAPAPVPAPGPVPDKEVLFWESVRDSRNPAMFSAYLEQYPNGVFAALARAKITELQPSAAVPSAAPTPEAPIPARPEFGIENLDQERVTLSALFVRSEPNTGAKTIGKLGMDEIATVTGRLADGSWYRVNWGDAEGYVSAKLLAPVDPAEADAWQALQKRMSNADLAAFIEKYPNGHFASKARNRLKATLSFPGEGAGGTPGTAGPISEADEAHLSKLPEDLRPGGAVIAAFNASPALQALPAPKPYRMNYHFTAPDGISVKNTRDVSLLGRLTLTTDTFSVCRKWGNSTCELWSKATEKSVIAGLVPLSSLQEISEDGAKTTTSLLTIDLTAVDGALLPLQDGKSLSFESAARIDHSDASGKPSHSVSHRKTSYRIDYALSCGNVHPSIPGICFVIVGETLDQAMTTPATRFHLYYVKDLNTILPGDILGADGRIQSKLTVDAFAVK